MGLKNSIVILTYNNLDYTRQCLESIYAETPAGEFEVIVVDNASQDGTPSYLQEFEQTHSDFHIRLNEENVGFAAGNNQGVQLASGENIIFLNNDILVTQGWLDGLTLRLQDPQVGMVGPVTNAAGNECRIPVDYQDISDMPKFARRYTSRRRGRSFEIKMLPLHCAALRRSTIAEIGGLDERFGVGMFEDDDYALRLKQAGYRILCVEDVFVHHFGSASFSRLGASTYWRIFIENRKKFEEKWGIHWTPQLLRPELIPQQVEQLVEGSIYLGGIAASQEEYVNRLTTEMVEKNRGLDEVSRMNSQLSIDLENREAYITDLHRSRAWKLIRFLWRVRLFFSPPGGLRAAGQNFGITLLSMVAGITRSLLHLGFGLLLRLFPLRLRQALVRRLPRPIAKFYDSYRFQAQYPDRSQVILFADKTILPAYSPRRPLKTPPGTASERVAVSLISTVKNEATSAVPWLESLLKQARLPDEVVISDGGSTDGTVRILRDFARKFPIPMQVIEAPGTNISQGRNIAIEHASNPTIACSDFGSLLDPDWLGNLIAPLEQDPKIDLSAGFYQAVIKDDLDRVSARYFIPDITAVSPQNFLPSGRSIAFRKDFWRRIGGYPEWLTDAGEDTLFDLRAKSLPSTWAFVPQAKAAWRAPRSFRKMYQTYYRYARGDGEAALHAGLYWEKTEKAFEVFAFLGLILILILLSAIFIHTWALALLLGFGILVFLRFLVQSILAANAVHVSLLLGMRDAIITWLVNVAQISGFFQGVASRPNVQKRRAAVYEGSLQEILTSHPDRKGVIIYPPTHDWGFMFQRPQQMARAFAKENFLYFYCTNNEKTDTVSGFQEVEPNLYLCHVPLETFRGIPKPVVYIGSPWHRETLELFDRPTVIYDHYDDLEVSSARPQDHADLLRLADIVLVTSQKLVESTKASRPDAIFTPNGVDYAFIQSNRPKPREAMPPDLSAVAKKGCPIIGYSGAIASWFDYELLEFAARSRPDYQFILIGVNYDGSLDRSLILKLQNVHWLGLKPYDGLFGYVWRFDVATIPFKVNRITLATSPIKMYEYMACRKLVVTTALPECKRNNEVLVAETKEQFVSHLDTALAQKDDAARLQALELVALENTWEGRARTIISRLQKISPERKLPGGLNG